MVSLPGVGAGVVFKSLVAARSLRSSYPASTGAVSLFVSRQPAGPRGSPGGRRAGPGATAGADRWRPASRASRTVSVVGLVSSVLCRHNTTRY